jgi:hypothetical protein
VAKIQNQVSRALACRGPRYLTTREAAKPAIVGTAKVSPAGAAKLTI